MKTAHVFELQAKTVSEANSTEHWTKKHRRHKMQQTLVRLAFMKYVDRVELPCIVTMTRLSPRMLDDDNLQMAFKYIRDEISECLVPEMRKAYINKRGKVQQIKGRADSDPRITWRYEQRKAARMGIEVMIEGATDKKAKDGTQTDDGPSAHLVSSTF